MKSCQKFLIFVLLTYLSQNTFALDTVAVKQLYPGVTYYHITSPEPLSIHLLETDLSNNAIKLELEIANGGLNRGGETTSSAAKRRLDEGNRVIAAVNCDFFGGPGDWQAENSMIKQGEYVKGARLERTMMAFTSNNTPYIGDFQFEGFILAAGDTIFLSGLNIYNETSEPKLFNDYWSLPVKVKTDFFYYSLINTETIAVNNKTDFAWRQIIPNDTAYVLKEDEWLIELSPEDFKAHENAILSSQFVEMFLGTVSKKENIYTLFGGLPGLVKDGTRPEDYIGIEELTSKSFVRKNPRTAIGYSEDKSKLYVVVVDGRQQKLSAGMTLYELADYMISLGCHDVLNLDGGGSSTMTIEDVVVNSPSDKSGERAVYNMLFISAEND